MKQRTLNLIKLAHNLDLKYLAAQLTQLGQEADLIAEKFDEKNQNNKKSQEISILCNDVRSSFQALKENVSPKSLNSLKLSLNKLMFLVNKLGQITHDSILKQMIYSSVVTIYQRVLEQLNAAS